MTVPSAGFHFLTFDWLRRTAHRSSKKLYEQCVKLEKLWSHVFTTVVPLTQRDTWYRKLREAIDREQNQAIWISETKVSTAALWWPFSRSPDLGPFGRQPIELPTDAILRPLVDRGPPLPPPPLEWAEMAADWSAFQVVVDDLSETNNNHVPGLKVRRPLSLIREEVADYV
jgi:hypothetical protein